MSDYIDRDAFLADKIKQYCSDCDKRKGYRNGKVKFCYEIGDAPCRACGIGDVLDDVEDYPAADVRENVPGDMPWRDRNHEGPAQICDGMKGGLTMTNGDSVNVLFEQIYLIDKTSLMLERGSKEYNAFRKIHYDNCKNIEAAGLSEEYYNYLFDHVIKPSMEVKEDG